MTRTLAAAIFALIGITARAQAAMVDGTFRGTIYLSNGSAVAIPISGTFEYNPAAYTYSSAASTPYSSTFAPNSAFAMSITEMSSLVARRSEFVSMVGFSCGRRSISI